MIGTDHHDTAMEEADFLAELARCVPRLEEPCGIPSRPRCSSSRASRPRDVKVVLAGQGADEPHGGYGRHRAAAVLRHLQHVPGSWPRPRRPQARAVPRAANAQARRPAPRRAWTTQSGCVRLVEITRPRPARRRSAAAGASRPRRSGVALARDVLGDVAGRDLLEQALYLDTRMFLPDAILLCNDKMSMAAGLELRVPFLDRELMRFVRARSRAPRVRPRAASACTGEAHARAAPARDRGPPQARLLHPVRQLAARIAREPRWSAATRQGSELGGLVAPGAVARLVAEHRRGRADHKSILYCLLELSEWHRAFVEAAEPVAA